MPNPNRTLITFLVDRSGSMHTIKTDVEGGFAAFTEEQRTTTGECLVTLAQFNHAYEVTYSWQPLDDLPALHISPRGRTALLDAMGRLITDTRSEIENMPDSERPGTVIIAILTDGAENASRAWPWPIVKQLVEDATNNHDWQFVYLGADQDAIEVGARLGIKREQAATYSRGKSRDALTAVSSNVRRYRYDKTLNPQAMMPEFSDAQRADIADDCTPHTTQGESP
ncbi:VWA domain-containing protein [Hoyosella rhizosphaerae]|uniref:VWA domain-containing protein n=1 Tax=Hoyosella rhizosphaerae TaxID=1755582 RepID=A0A916UJ61_9ACTN|nr:VWA domain-containing protein [Hoyosella rhizosphaerae]MBN4928345.1 VWA domain-containing protein [Hoyosella rhizosphaerae]GGC74231.1 hypothetical protein GCM10011410_29370 [Hoyosella rhizosphaerae]